jgi:N-acetylglucosamine malate deacetylase 2
MIRMLILITAVILVSCGRSVDYKSWKETQDYTVPQWVDTFENKRALVVFPHPDDEVVVGGTIAHLINTGWRVSLLTLTKGNPAEKEVREAEWLESARILGFKNYELLDFPNNSWESVLSNNIEFWYSDTDSIEETIYQAILKYQPSVIIGYDTVFGAYGHPEHRIAALASYNAVMKHRGDSAFTVSCILMSTLPEKMEQKLIGSSEAYLNAQKVTGYSRLPVPTTRFDILATWPTKAAAAAVYKSQAPILKKFFILPDDSKRALHYDTFDREYFTEIWVKAGVWGKG